MPNKTDSRRLARKMSGRARRRVARVGAAARRRRIRWLVIGGGVLAVVSVAAAIVVSGRSARPISGLERFSGLSREHVSGTIDYPQSPPVGGKHAGVWLNCGVYDRPVPAAAAVHSLEHGAVWVMYAPDLPAKQVSSLKRLVQGRRFTILSPYPGLRTPVAAVAWGLRLMLPSASDRRLRSFVRKYAAGPQTPEPGATCSGGIG